MRFLNLVKGRAPKLMKGTKVEHKSNFDSAKKL